MLDFAKYKTPLVLKRYLVPFGLLALCVAVVLPATALAFHTVGEVRQFPYFFFVVLLMVSAMLILPLPRQSAVFAAVVTLLFTVTLLPVQVQLGVRLYRLKAEVRAIVDHLDNAVASDGAAPKDLSKYTFASPDLQDHVRYYARGGRHYYVSFWVVDSHISHWYDSTSGWGYYPD
ncbi:MAG: hypothetical protein AAF581_03140 [Planctomycetota bacterium]